MGCNWVKMELIMEKGLNGMKMWEEEGDEEMGKSVQKFH
jgi:hypothetical protein